LSLAWLGSDKSKAEANLIASNRLRKGCFLTSGGLRPVEIRGKPVRLRGRRSNGSRKASVFQHRTGRCSKPGRSAFKRTGFALLGERKASTTRRKLAI